MHCPKCRMELPSYAIFCKYCGIKICEAGNSNRDINSDYGDNSKIQIESVGKERKKSDFPLDQNKQIAEKSTKRKQVFIAGISIVLFSLILLISILSGDHNKLGNPKANLINDFDFCCQAKDSEVYLTYPTSRTIWKYSNGELTEAYRSDYAILSIFDTGSNIVVESLDYGISMINKRTGEEKEIEGLWRSNILNTYKETLYLVVPPENTASVATYCDLETYALNLKTGQRTQLANGGCYVSERGVYFVIPNNDTYDIRFVSHSTINMPMYKTVDSVRVNNSDETPILIMVDQDWFYYLIYDSGSSGYRIIRKSGNTVEDLFSARSIFFHPASVACFENNSGDFYLYDPRSSADPERIELKAVDTDLVFSSDCMSFFQDPQRKDVMLFCTTSYKAPGYLCIWNEDGVMLSSIKIDDAMLG